MESIEKIRTVIVDDTQDAIDCLAKKLSDFEDIELCGVSTQYKKGRELLVKENPDLAFLDVEMPGKDGFDLLNEVRKKGCNSSVIFYTAYDKYVIRALRESAFDYILKPVDSSDLKKAIDRYKLQRELRQSIASPRSESGMNETIGVVALPTHLGLRFVDRNQILLFRCIREKRINKPCWEALLTNLSSIKLGTSTTADRIIQLFKEKQFMQINQSCIINLHYMSMVEFKSKICLLVPPYDNMKLTVSRSYLLKLREMYEKI